MISSAKVIMANDIISQSKLELELESFYSITTFIRAITSLLQIRQVAHLMEHYMQPARIKPHA